MHDGPGRSARRPRMDPMSGLFDHLPFDQPVPSMTPSAASGHASEAGAWQQQFEKE